MIIDKMDKLESYLPEAIRKDVIAFVSGLTVDTPDGEYKIIGDSVFAKVISCSLKAADACKIEAHDYYIDIQSVVMGEERIDVFERAGLSEDAPYNEAKDVIFYKPGSLLHSLTVKEKYFMVLFPHEAHRPQIEVPCCNSVKKFVLKIKTDLWK